MELEQQNLTQANLKQKEENPFVNDNMSVNQRREIKENTVFVSNISMDILERQIKQHFKECGEVLIIKLTPVIIVNKQNSITSIEESQNKKWTQNGYILFDSKEVFNKQINKFMQAVLKALKYTKLLKGQVVNVSQTSEIDFTKTIYVSNLNNVDSDMLQAHFAPCGEIKSVRVIKDKESNECKGFGFVYFSSIDGYDKGLEMNGTSLNGVQISVKKAQERKKLDNNQHMIKRLEKKISKNRPKKEKYNIDHVNSFTRTQFDQNYDVDYRNVIQGPPRVIRRKIRKDRKKNIETSQIISNVLQMKKIFNTTNDKNIFNIQQPMQKRRDERKRKIEKNRGKVKNEIIQQKKK